jgi:Ras family protein
LTNTFLTLKFRHIPTADREWVKTDVFLESEFRLEVHDSSGMDDSTHISASWVGTIDAFVIMYAINDRDSFNIALLIRSKLAEAMGQCEETCTIPITLIGNKRDKKSERQITKTEVLNHIKVNFFCKKISKKHCVAPKEP